MTSGPSNLVGKVCADGYRFKSNANQLHDKEVRDLLKMVLDYKSWGTSSRSDHMFRVHYITEFLKSDNPDIIPCMYSVPGDRLSELTAKLKPPCVGNGSVDFSKFNDIICNCYDQLNRRFREFVITGMCHLCQAWYIERDFGEN